MTEQDAWCRAYEILALIKDRIASAGIELTAIEETERDPQGNAYFYYTARRDRLCLTASILAENGVVTVSAMMDMAAPDYLRSEFEDEPDFLVAIDFSARYTNSEAPDEVWSWEFILNEPESLTRQLRFFLESMIPLLHFLYDFHEGSFPGATEALQLLDYVLIDFQEM
jgi:hypothetical protein